MSKKLKNIMKEYNWNIFRKKNLEIIVQNLLKNKNY